MYDYRISIGTAPRRAFTILELMIAAAATLLIMAALTRAFALIGNRINNSRAEVALSGDARDVNFRLRSELAASTASTDPSRPNDGTGYLMYYEGPHTQAMTSTIYGFGPAGQLQTTENQADGYLPLSRWGDNDDFLAFTARAREGSAFRGIVPRGVLEAKRVVQVESAGDTYAMPSSYDPSEPVVIESEYAEIVYWVAPRIDGGTPYAADNGDNSDGMNESGMPNYIDADTNGLPNGTSNTLSDGYPDQLVLYRRVLLVRPDLNLAENDIPSSRVGTISTNAADQEVLCYLDSNGKINSANGLVSPGVWSFEISSDAPNWLVGMANVQQEMDLSVARDFVLASGNGVSTGVPASVYSANNLEQLRDPHRRFGHVMMPGGLSIHGSAPIGTGAGCSMPLLALSPPTRFLAAAAAGTSPVTTLLTGSSTVSSISDKFTMVGYLRPEFVLQGERAGEDIIASNVVTFDVQAYDATAPVFVAVGSDNEPGRPGVDDDLNGMTDDVSELGAALSDDRMVNPNDPYAYFAVRDTSVARPVSQGTFVDLGYFFQSGGNIRSRADWNGSSTPPGGYLWHEYGALCSSPFSGLSYTAPAGPPNGLAAPGAFVIWPGLRRSGKCLLRSGGQYFVQPTYDSWTSGYENDGLNQVTYDPTPAPGRPTPPEADFNGMDCGTTYWVFNPPTNGDSPFPAPPVPPGDFTDPMTTVDVFKNGTQVTDTAPPIQKPLAAIKVTFENYDTATRQISTTEVIHDFLK